MAQLLRMQSGYRRSRQALFDGEVQVPRGLPPVLISPSQPDALGPEHGVYVRLPGADFPPAGATAVDEIGDADIAPGASATLVTIPVGDTLRFRVAGIGFGADDESVLRFLTWSVILNGLDPVGAYNNRTSVIGSIRQLADVFLLVGSSSIVTVVATSSATAALTYRFICRVRGWFYNEKESG